MEIKRLYKENYDELIQLLNTVFGIKNRREVSFELDLPKMCKRTDEAMNKHLGVFEDGRLVAALGIYPLPTKIMGEDFLFSTVGNVATHPDYEGRGYMGAMMNAAMEGLRRIGADASRLGGARQRYNRFGYEMSGVAYDFTIGEHNTKHAFRDTSDISFKLIKRDDTEALSYVKKMHEREEIYCVRSDEDELFDVYASAVAWQAKPYTVMRGDERIGYVSLAKDESTVAELYAESDDDFIDIVGALQRWTKKAVQIRLPEYKTSLLSRLAAVCSSVTTLPVCHFKMISFDKIADALMRLKASYRRMPEGEFLLGIEGFGTLRLYSDNGRVGAELSKKAASVTLDKLTATRFLFGHMPSSLIAAVPPFVENWLPLPLFWNLQDRV